MNRFGKTRKSLYPSHSNYGNVKFAVTIDKKMITSLASICLRGHHLWPDVIRSYILSKSRHEDQCMAP